MVVPTLTAGEPLRECLESLEQQAFRDFETVVVDNSGCGKVSRLRLPDRARVIENPHNVGFGAAVNQGFWTSRSRYLATLNDDASAYPGWLEEMVQVMESNPEAGMCAPQIRLARSGMLDSAGMLLCADGSSKQRGHGRPPEQFAAAEEVFFPSGCAALYRRAMLEEIGGFDESFFLYSEDTDLGLRARWAGYRCWYVPEAVVEHRYSGTAGRASPLKAYFVERNRLYVLVKNFPCAALARAPWAAFARYGWHTLSLFSRRGSAGRFREAGHNGWRLPYYVLKAHLALGPALPQLLRERQRIRRTARITSSEFLRLMRRYAIRPREVALQ